MDEMNAAVLTSPAKIEYKRVKTPILMTDELLVKVKTCGVCGSDVAYYERGMADIPPPIILGHEFTGEIVELGEIPEKQGTLKMGDRVVVEPVQACGVCKQCKMARPNFCSKPTVPGVTVDGGFAEYCKSNYRYVHLLPDDVSYEDGAFTEPLACAVRAIEKMRIKPGDFCVVIGPGPIGLMMAQYIKSYGADKTVIIGTRDYRLEAGESLGADYLINIKDGKSEYFTDDPVKTVREWNDGEGADAVVVPSGSPEASALGIDVGGVMSRIVLFGGAGYDPKAYINLRLWDGNKEEKEILFSWLSPYTFPTALKALSSGQVKVESLITHTFPLDKTSEAITTAQKRIGDAIKVQVKP